MRPLALTMCVMLLVACGEDPPAGNGQRFVEQDKLHNPIVDTESVDLAVQTEAMTHMRLIADRVKLKAATGGDPAGLYRSIGGQVNATTLSKIGLSESDLKGTYYIASDYNITISGNTMMISAAQKGTRGRVEPQTFTLP